MLSVLGLISALALPLVKLWLWWKGGNNGDKDALEAKEEEVKVMGEPARSKSATLAELRKHD